MRITPILSSRSSQLYRVCISIHPEHPNCHRHVGPKQYEPHVCQQYWREQARKRGFSPTPASEFDSPHNLIRMHEARAGSWPRKLTNGRSSNVLQTSHGPVEHVAFSIISASLNYTPMSPCDLTTTYGTRVVTAGQMVAAWRVPFLWD